MSRMFMRSDVWGGICACSPMMLQMYEKIFVFANFFCVFCNMACVGYIMWQRLPRTGQALL